MARAMQSCDVMVVGGGPAGSSCAWRLRRADVDVVVLDKATFPRDKVCAGWITPAVLKELDIDRDEYSRGRVMQPITAFRTGVIGGREVFTDYGYSVSFGIRRCEFDHYLLMRSGARLCLGQPLISLQRDGRDWIVNDEFRTPMLVSAGGHFCPVARSVARSDNLGPPVVAAQEIEFEMSPSQIADCHIEPDVPELYFCADLKGYGWCFRKGDVLNIGLGREDRTRLSEHVTRFGDFLHKRGKIPATVAHRFHGHAYLLYGRSRRPLSSEGLLLVGDAAGLAYAQSGEGIRPAVESGLMAAQVILAADGDYGHGKLNRYDRLVIDRFGSRRLQGRRPSFTPAWLKRPIAARLLASPWFSRRVLLDGWFLHRSQLPLTDPLVSPPPVASAN